jgi:hypothetical protein
MYAVEFFLKIGAEDRVHPLKDSVAGKIIRAGWDSKFRAEILFDQKPTKV